MKMLVTEGLNELKTLNSRINRAIETANFVDYAKTSCDKVTPAKTKEDFKNEALAARDSIFDLIRRRELIKAAIVASNAVTEVEICGKKMTVAEAIETKNSIQYKKGLLTIMSEQYESALAGMNRKNTEMEKKIDDMVMVTFGKDRKEPVSATEYDAIAKPYRASNEYSLVDPIGIADEIKKLQEYIEEFEATVDSKLQISNCITTIDV